MICLASDMAVRLGRVQSMNMVYFCQAGLILRCALHQFCGVFVDGKKQIDANTEIGGPQHSATIFAANVLGFQAPAWLTGTTDDRNTAEGTA